MYFTGIYNCYVVLLFKLIMFKSGITNDKMDTLTIDLVIAKYLKFIVKDYIDILYIPYMTVV